MSWVDKIDKYTLLGLKRISGYPVITPQHQDRKYTYWTATTSHGGRQLELGSTKSIAYMQRQSVSRFVVGSYGDVEVEFFYLIKGRDQIWNAYRDDCAEMFRIEDIGQLDYDLVEQLIDEFENKRNR